MENKFFVYLLKVCGLLKIVNFSYIKKHSGHLFTHNTVCSKCLLFKCLCEDNFYFLLDASLSSDTMPYAFRPKDTISHLKMSQSSILTSMGSLSSMGSSYLCWNNLIERVNLPKKQDRSRTCFKAVIIYWFASPHYTIEKLKRIR